MPFANLKDIRLFYETRGTGGALVLIPGFASGAWSWFKQTEELSKDFLVIAFDPRGVSRSQISDGANVSLRTIAEDVKNLLDALKIERAHVLGASFGGFVAQEFALSFPERIDKLILACTSFGGKNHVAPDFEVLSAFVSTQNLNSAGRIRKFIVPAFTAAFAEEHAGTIEKVCVLRERNFVPEAIYMAQLKAATTFDFETRAARIRAETLIITGDKDVVVPPENSTNLARAIPDARLEIVKGGSHMFFIERADEFNCAVKQFIIGH